jgi:uncharacterized protein with ACT and thioredoxin-like domain
LGGERIGIVGGHASLRNVKRPARREADRSLDDALGTGD